jgi:hypothetical protein
MQYRHCHQSMPIFWMRGIGLETHVVASMRGRNSGDHDTRWIP